MRRIICFRFTVIFAERTKILCVQCVGFEFLRPPIHPSKIIHDTPWSRWNQMKWKKGETQNFKMKWQLIVCRVQTAKKTAFFANWMEMIACYRIIISNEYEKKDRMKTTNYLPFCWNGNFVGYSFSSAMPMHQHAAVFVAVASAFAHRM